MGKREIKTETTWVRLQWRQLELGSADAFLRAPEVGGVHLFLGTTRQWTDGRETIRLEFEAYEEMALKQMQRLTERARQKWAPVRHACILHRLGEVPPEEASVLCGVAAPHRKTSFAACRFLIDRLKEQVPIWKKETPGRREGVGLKWSLSRRLGCTALLERKNCRGVALD